MSMMHDEAVRLMADSRPLDYEALVSGYDRAYARVLAEGLNNLEKNMEFFHPDPYCLEPLAMEIRKDRL